ncbi:MAG: hypothetical protein HFK07_02350 [Clostridia bacterium]|nr:hypothetical protein [Clostridia bacterium]
MNVSLASLDGIATQYASPTMGDKETFTHRLKPCSRAFYFCLRQRTV